MELRPAQRQAAGDLWLSNDQATWVTLEAAGPVLAKGLRSGAKGEARSEAALGCCLGHLVPSHLV